ncbi:hypothetical protein PN465_12580 [Nodularia spumigena CS-584]|jgi:hypothetical protein|uniref:hypothetical protein n=1 Tax=Nodularia spumigena TaxID=70799 RepID=UPI0000EAD4EC|nr:hypothetical protein [Nodularia spumigena]EAW45458.1 WD-repeat protein [Nodularia spumigena CCY9414]MDB9320876.1 hypothetical protein [Nodularia spumigena CS-591/07A]MDB9332002.1 hypothetical protein [Nodularia spumigena CS-591/04]MDB9362773.1 hypothetical protein [Nodularia spumigena CS-588/02]MDB9363325.1 hypothetical protein [Nodularia spumigena CS-588/02A10]
MPKKQRKRGAILTPKGLHKLQYARQQAEFNENKNKRFTLDYLSYHIGLDTHTLCKIFRRKSKVDTQSLTRCFQAFNLLLEPDDYEIPTTPLLITSSQSQQPEAYKDKTLDRQESEELGLKFDLDVNEVRLTMTAPTEIRQRAIALLQQLPGESLLKALEFLESLAYESLPLSETPETANSEAALLQIIQSRLSLEEQNRFSYLRQQKENGEITEAENQELLTYINRVKQQDTDA